MTSSPGSPTSPTRPSDAGRPVLVRVAGLVLALALVAAGCSSARAGGAGQEAAAGDGGGGGGGAAGVATKKVDQAPDTLPDPGVGPGACQIVTYTPPTSASPQQGELCRPKASQRDALVIIVHGGAGIAGTFAGLRPWQTRLNAEGYPTLNIDYHLFQPGIQSPVFPQPEQNVKAAVQFVRGTGNALGIRKDRIAVQGHSAGARLGAVAYTTPGDTYFAGNELWPGLDDTVNAFIGFYHPFDGSMQYQDQYYGGSDTSQLAVVQQRWDEADSLDHAERAKGPALLLTGDKDWDLQITQQDQMKATLEGAGQTARTVVVAGGGHGFDEGDGTRLSRLGEQAATEVLRFLNDVFPQDPARPAQSEQPDLDNAPTGTGVTQTTFAPRPRSTTPTTTRRPGSAGSGAGSGGQTAATTTTTRPVTSSSVTTPATSTKPTVTTPPTSSPVTTAKPPVSSTPVKPGG
ncbi:MAG: alpha/beta hydrolase [Acidimicrobiales bacterium]